MNVKQREILEEIQSRFEALVRKQEMESCHITIKSRGLTPEEAIGNTARKDYPILTGKEIMLQAECEGAVGQAFTDAPASFTGTLDDVLMQDMVNDPHARGLYFATINAVMRYLDLVEGTIHCRNEEPELCAGIWLDKLAREYSGKNVALVGYQPALLEKLSASLTIRVLDLNPDNIGQKRWGVVVEHGIKDHEAVLDWADVVLCTGSVFCNATMDQYVDIGKEVIFFGTSASGVVRLLDLKRFCPKGH